MFAGLHDPVATTKHNTVGARRHLCHSCCHVLRSHWLACLQHALHAVHLQCSVMWALTAALAAAVVWQGGVIRDEDDIKQTQQLQLAMIERRQRQSQQQRGGGSATTVAAI